MADSFFLFLSSWWGLPMSLAIALFVVGSFIFLVTLGSTYWCAFRCGARRRQRELNGNEWNKKAGEGDAPEMTEHAANIVANQYHYEHQYKELAAVQKEGGQLPPGVVAVSASFLSGNNVENDMLLHGVHAKARFKPPKSGNGKYYGDYQVYKKIGAGQFGTVWLVKKDDDETFYALKTIDAQTVRGPKAALREVALLSSLHHPNIVAYQEEFTVEEDDKEIICIVMEFCQYGALPDILTARKHLSEEGIMVWFARLVDALQYIHRRDIVHRDLKPENIFVNDQFDLKIGDFGVATALTVDHTATTNAAGTPVYMAPEVLQNQKYNTLADVWSLGVILYRMVTRKELKTIVCLDVASGRLPEMLAAIPSTYSADIHHLIKRLLAVDPTDRPSIDVFRQDPVYLAWDMVLFFENRKFIAQAETLPAEVIPVLINFLDTRAVKLRMATRTNAFAVLAHLLTSGCQAEERAKAAAPRLHTLIKFIPKLEPVVQLSALSVVYSLLVNYHPNVLVFCAAPINGINFVSRYLLPSEELKTTLTALLIIKHTLILDVPSQVQKHQHMVRESSALAAIVALMSHASALVAYEAARVLFYALENVARDITLTERQEACTFLASRQEVYRHRAYLCRTCGPQESGHDECVMVCVSCAEACHMFHDLVPLAPTAFRCDCGAGASSVKCDCLGFLGQVPMTLNEVTQNHKLISESVIPVLVAALVDPSPVAVPIFLRLLTAVTYSNKGAKKIMVETQGIEMIARHTLPRAVKHPEGTIIGINALTAAVEYNVAGVKTFGRRRCEVLLEMLADRSDVALPIAILRLLEAIVFTGSRANNQRMEEAGIVDSLRARLIELKMEGYASDELLAALELSRGDARIKVEDFDTFRHNSSSSRQVPVVAAGSGSGSGSGSHSSSSSSSSSSSKSKSKSPARSGAASSSVSSLASGVGGSPSKKKAAAKKLKAPGAGKKVAPATAAKPTSSASEVEGDARPMIKAGKKKASAKKAAKAKKAVGKKPVGRKSGSRSGSG